jgi:diguanylate cyclase (GGDEF)-like protein
MNESSQKQRILIVDDAPINIKVLNEALRELYRISFATNGVSALDMARATPPDLILLDIMMPEMDGYEVCRIIKSDALLQDIPVIFITAMSEAEDEAVGLELGAVDYIAKPFNTKLVQLRVRNHLELKRQRDILGRLSSLDGLTGLANRRSFDELLAREWRRAARTAMPLSLVMNDVDYFKAYNDSRGHLAGDECLKAIAMCVASASRRASDVAARYGGEEFALVLPNTPETGALALAEGIRASIEGLRLPHDASPISPVVTVSLGAACVFPEREQNSTILIARADELLYKSKHDGRNRVSPQAVSD